MIREYSYCDKPHFAFHDYPGRYEVGACDWLNDCLGLSVRAYNCLINAGCHSVNEIIEATDKQLLDIPNLGRGTLRELRERFRHAPSPIECLAHLYPDEQIGA